MSFVGSGLNRAIDAPVASKGAARYVMRVSGRDHGRGTSPGWMSIPAADGRALECSGNQMCLTVDLVKLKEAFARQAMTWRHFSRSHDLISAFECEEEGSATKV